MPEMDGLEAAFRIRQIEAQSPSNGCQLCAESQQALSSGMQVPCSCGGIPERHVPIWAISACSDEEQLCSPVSSQIRSEGLEGASPATKHL